MVVGAGTAAELDPDLCAGAFSSSSSGSNSDCRCAMAVWSPTYHAFRAPSYTYVCLGTIARTIARFRKVRSDQL